MKIAILFSDQLVSSLSAIEAFTQNLAKQAEFKIVLLNGNSIKDLSEIFEQANQYDLIHNLAGVTPLLFSRFTTTPVLTTLLTNISSEDEAILKKYNSEGFYVATSNEFSHPDLKCYDAFAHSFETENTSQTAEAYLALYEKIIKQTQREDHRPWGFYEILSDSPTHKVKRITVFPGKRLSYQRHFKRAEHWYIVHGKATVTLDGKDIPLKAGEAVDLPLQAWHRIQNPGEENMVFIEVQTGSYFGEDDIERAQDDYGRA